MWYVFLQDTNGSRRFVGHPFAFATEMEGQQRVADIEGRHTKLHKVDYWVVYGENRDQVVNQYQIQ